jgi:oxygen-independent coproporphyrinogen-3 oxidase
VVIEDNAEALGVYVSVPFCRAKCSFCNFASGVSGPEAIEEYVGKLCAEIAAVGETAAGLGARLPRRVDSVYLGGGTPSLLEPEQLRRIFAALRVEFAVEDGAEITLEAAPGQIEGDVLAEAMRLGVNRVSLGVQSFVDRESQAVGRTHTEVGCVAEIRRLRAAGMLDVGADLIAGLPYQTRESWGYSVKVARRLRGEGALTHLSVYMLEVDEDSRLGREVLAGGLRLHAPRVPGEDVAAEFYEMACEALPGAGFGQYEISNFAAEGRESRHNRKYWERKPYMGFGLDAHSMLRAGSSEGSDAVRFANAEELAEYGVREREVTRVGVDEAFEEAVFLGLRLCDGVDAGELQAEFGAERVGRFARTAEELRREGLMEFTGGRWRLTVRGRLVSNEVFGRLLEGE